MERSILDWSVVLTTHPSFEDFIGCTTASVLIRFMLGLLKQSGRA